MNNYYVDLHIHIGRTKSGRPVKITGSKSLTLENILYEASFIKGMDMVGVIDCHVPEVLQELMELIDSGKVQVESGGGLRFSNVTLILGSEIEINDQQCNGPLHVLAYMPTVEKMQHFSDWLSKRMKNITLSTQRLYETGMNLQKKVKECSGLFIPAHVFTPHKSLYGSGVQQSLTEVFDPSNIDGIELGLSSNTEMADQITELHSYTFVSNSDAHSLGKIAREYQIMKMEHPSFDELKSVLHQKGDRRIVANYGLDPRLGKYHRTTCEKCFTRMDNEENCPHCGHHRVVKGVYERLQEIKAGNKQLEVSHKPERPPYVHQVPLDFIPKLGPKTLEKLRDHFGTDMNIIHNVPEQQLKQIVPSIVADMILLARAGRISMTSGGGGRYGKVVINSDPENK
ncbi:endonuclease Q family protein [Bacillus sp. Marseille-P3661]|uniref:endonuclease Q family protein n=1 Tax=Bacillus sp. Marseille-P3661 TaxID=1936234 RepID=UPI000C85E412|nr:endonuclease Q family protein [Bacillus sp. Marseille-P3661]